MRWIWPIAFLLIPLATVASAQEAKGPPPADLPAAHPQPEAGPAKVEPGPVEVRRGYKLQLGGWSARFSLPESIDLVDLVDRARGFVGMLAILGVAVFLSENRRAISGRIVFWGLILQWTFAIFVLRVPAGIQAMRAAGGTVESVLGCALEGAKFVFGDALVNPGGPGGFVFAFRVLPTVIFVAALFAALYYLHVMQWIVRLFAVVMAWFMGTSGAESLNVAASLFLGQTEAPLTIRPYLPRLTRSELLTVMTSGMAHVSGGIMAVYFGYGVEPRHIITAVIMTAPGTILLSKLFLPETQKPETLGHTRPSSEVEDANVLDAISRGTRDGLTLALNIAAMLIAILGLIALINLGLGQVGTSLQKILGWLLAPVAYLLGVPWEDCREVGGLLGTRTVLNEVIAFKDLGALKATILPRSFDIASFALCGFANFSSIGIQLGGIGALVPERRRDLAELGWRALLAGTMANFLSACIAGILL
ncbi:NupC/NupG family nucleoside CNT transporter [Aquisphaera insulae]|uniref:NupC/NupG family nucleoside CNT transporter n=1 Tax=Aquisphaera insulae TaxID=2712864 RepID=UPI00196B15C3|nr:nucleoside transporter C-terminal domain-containing protein [Aquisphaera insulae]